MNRMIQEGVDRVGREDGTRLLEVWEASVRATHRFLSEADIQFFKPLVLDELFSLQHLLCLRDTAGDLVGFVGVADGKMEALFVHPSWHRAGVGRRLAQHAIVELGATKVDVNEQNGQAVAFYVQLGFEVQGRSELDNMASHSRFFTCVCVTSPRRKHMEKGPHICGPWLHILKWYLTAVRPHLRLSDCYSRRTLLELD